MKSGITQTINLRLDMIHSRFSFIACIGILFSIISSVVHADCGGPSLHVGWFAAKQGKSQHINVDGLVGDQFSVSKTCDQNFLVGVGYDFHGFDGDSFSLLYGIHAFYLASTQVKGKVTQENLFTNLSYRYSLINYPIYFSAKGSIRFCADQDLVIELGIGPNIITTKSFKERSLDGGITLPDSHIFKGKTSIAFSATAGLGWRINRLFDSFSFGIDYRFFYLGQGELKKGNNQVRNPLRTGNSYGNALFFSFSL
jgi:hypothetical protein